MSTSVEKLAALFQGFEQAHGTHGVPDRDPNGLKWNIKRTAETIRAPATKEMWRQHVAGERPLGIVPIRKDNTCSWGSIDFDQYDVDLVALIRGLEASKLPLVPCRSKSGGLHLFLFLEEPEAANMVQAALRDAAASLGMAECEIFPKQTQVLAERKDVGNWMVMPYFGGTFNGKLQMQHGLKKNGADMTLDEFVKYAASKRTTTDKIFAVSSTRRKPPTSKLNGKSQDGSRDKSPGDGPSLLDFSDGPPCLQHLVKAGIQADGRKRTLFMIGIYLKRASSGDPEVWKKKLENVNQKLFTPPLPTAEVNSIQNSLTKKDYEYTCKEEPMKSRCDSSLCRGRRFGVGLRGSVPVISSMSKLETDPPVWFITVGDHRLEMMTDDLQSYVKFHKHCMNKSMVFQTMKQADWIAILAEAMEKCESLPAPPDLSESGQFHEYLQEFLTSRARGNQKDDLFLGRTFFDVEEKRHYFTLKSFETYLKQNGIKEIDRRKVSSYIVGLGGQGVQHNSRSARQYCRAWWVPASVVQELDDEDAVFDPPKLPESPI